MYIFYFFFFFFFKQKTAYEMSIGDWSSDVCSSDLRDHGVGRQRLVEVRLRGPKRQLGARGVFRPTGAWTPAQARAAPSQICGGSRRVRGRPSKSTAHRSLFTRRTDVREDVR